MASPLLALPAAPTPPRPRLLMVATSLAVAAGTMLFGGFLAVYLAMRHAAGGTTATWVPSSITFPEITLNVVAITLVGSVVVMHWALWAMANADRRNSYIALGLTVVLGFAALNAMAFSFNHMHLAVRDNAYSVMVVTIAGAFMVVLVGAMVFIGSDRVPHPRRPLLGEGARGHRCRHPVLGLHRRRVRGHLVLPLRPQVRQRCSPLDRGSSSA